MPSLSRIDKGTIAGLLCAAGGIFGGLLLEKGSLGDVVQLTALLIVAGGTLGAVLISTPWEDALAAFRSIRLVFLVPPDSSRQLATELVSFAGKARRRGIVSLDPELEAIEDTYFRKALSLAIDGTELTELRSMMTTEKAVEEQRILAHALVFESAGGYSPTIGILGAVLGLIQVMKNLANLDEVGRGIAVAFVATVYGVGLANLILLPAAGKIRFHARRRVEAMELILEGVIGIAQGLNPRMVYQKLSAHADLEADRPRRIPVAATPKQESVSA